MNTTVELLIAEMRQNIADAEALTLMLDDKAFNWRPARDRWPIAQCFGHLRRVNEMICRYWIALSQRGDAEAVYIPDLRSRPRSGAVYTSPIPPAPMGERISYGPSFVPADSGI